jgi:hypothetical protein
VRKITEIERECYGTAMPKLEARSPK